MLLLLEPELVPLQVLGLEPGQVLVPLQVLGLEPGQVLEPVLELGLGLPLQPHLKQPALRLSLPYRRP